MYGTTFISFEMGPFKLFVADNTNDMVTLFKNELLNLYEFNLVAFDTNLYAAYIDKHVNE